MKTLKEQFEDWFKERERIIPLHPHIFQETESQIDDWEERGCPHIWVNMEKTRQYEVYVDIAYGYIALIKNKKLRYVTAANEIIMSDVVVLDRNFYDTEYYLWEPINAKKKKGE